MMSDDPQNTLEIVLADDNFADQENARRVFGDHACKLSILSDGGSL